MPSRNSCKNIKIDSLNPQPELIKQAADIIRGGGVVAFPTWCLYGLGGDAFSEKAVGRIFDLKKRPPKKPLLILTDSEESITNIAEEIPDCARKIMKHFWPGKITIVFKAKKSVPDCLTAGTGKIGIRVPENAIAHAIVKELGFPITGTSANLSGQPGCSKTNELDPEVVNSVDLVIDGGTLKGGSGSTVIDVTTDKPTILREGVIPSEDIFSIL